MIERLKPEHMKRTADLLQRMPRTTRLLVSFLRITRARFTAGVIGVILNDHQQVLLVKHVFHPDYQWGFPGGWIERRESPREALKRELEEELGLVDVRIGVPLAVETGALFPTHLDVAFLCKTSAAITHISRELLEYRWVPLPEVPRLSPFHQRARDAAAVLAPYEVKVL